MNLESRFWSKVKIIDDEDSCWEWQGAIKDNGYGAIGVRENNKTKTEQAHRLSYLINCGQIPIGISVLHKCDNRKCVRPKHLFLGTHRDNMSDMALKGRQARGEKNGQARFTMEDIQSIRDSTLSHTNEAVKWDVLPGYIRRIRQKKIWS